MRVVAADAAPGAGLRGAHRLARRLRRRLLQRGLGALALPLRHALPHRGPSGPHGVRIRRHRGRGRRGDPRARVPRVPPRRLLRLAEAEDHGAAVLEDGHGMRGWVEDVRQDRVLDAIGLSPKEPLAYSGK